MWKPKWFAMTLSTSNVRWSIKFIRVLASQEDEHSNILLLEVARHVCWRTCVKRFDVMGLSERFFFVVWQWWQWQRLEVCVDRYTSHAIFLRYFYLSVFTPTCGSRCLWRAFTPSAYHSWWHMNVRLRFFAVTLHFSRFHPCFCSLHHSYLSDGTLMWDLPIVSSRILCLRPHRPHLKRVMNSGWTLKCWQTRYGW